MYKSLETFYWAARLGSFTAAAKRLNATQSTISTRIQELEEQLGVVLFDRSHRTARLTSKGQELVSYAERFIDLVREIEECVTNESSISGLVRVGVAEAISVTWLPRFVKSAHERYPRITIEYDVGLAHDHVNKLSADALDLIMTPGVIGGKAAVARSLGVVEYAWLSSPQLQRQRRRLDPIEVGKLPIIGLDRASHHYSIIARWFRGTNTEHGRINTCHSMSVVAALVQAGLGVSVFPLCCHADALADGSLVPLETDPCIEPVEFSAVMAERAARPAVQVMAELAIEMSTFKRQG